MPICNTPLDEKGKLVKVMNLPTALADMASGGHSFASSIAGVALSLELLHKPRPQAFRLCHDSVTPAPLTHLHVLRVVGAATPTVRAYSHLIVGDLSIERVMR